MFSVTCPTCSRVGTSKVAIPPGTNIRCPGCGNRFVAPDNPPDVYEPVDDVAPAPPPAPVKPATVSGTLPPEPWFYGWLEGAAKLLWFLACSVVAFASVIGGIGVIVAWASDERLLFWALIALGWMIALAFVSLLPLAIGSALIRLAVDHARNVRAIRFP